MEARVRSGERAYASSAFRDLSSLEWGEYNETYVDDFRANCTPLEEYRTLFSSEAFRNVKRFVWRNPVCSPRATLPS